MSDKSESNSRVASLTDDAAPAETDTASAVHLEEYEAEAVRYLQRGLQRDDIVNRLTKAGLSEKAADDLTKRVWREHSDERRTNAFILIGVAVILLVISVGLLAPRVLSGEPLPTISVLYLLIALAVWFVVKAVNDLRGTGTN